MRTIDSNDIDAFKELYSECHLDGAAEGIAMQLESRGKDSLSERQLEVIVIVVEKFCRNHTCAACGQNLGPEDVSAYLETGYDSYHAYQIEKDRND